MIKFLGVVLPSSLHSCDEPVFLVDETPGKEFMTTEFLLEGVS